MTVCVKTVLRLS